MLINGMFSELRLVPLAEMPGYRFEAKVTGLCTLEQFNKLREAWAKEGAVEIIKWDGVNPIYGMEITMRVNP